MTWPVTINGTTYNSSDFDPYGYTTALPALFNDLLAMAGAFAGTVPFTFDSTTSDVDPGAGEFRLNHGTASSATEGYFDNDSASGVTVSAWLDTLDDAGKSSDRGILRIQDVSAEGVVHFYRVTGSVVDGTGYRKLTLTWLAGAGAFTNGGGCVVSFVPRGADGATGSTGDAGSDGNDGWSPVFAIATDGERRVLQVDDWVGGEGSKPATGDYVGASGLTSTIGDAIDIRGAAGANGTNGSNGADGADPFYLMTFDTGTTSSGISGGQVRANNADLSSATALYVSKTNRSGSSIAARLLELGDAGKTVKDRLIITNPAADTQASYVVDSITDDTGFVTIAVSSHDGATSFADDLAISFQPILSGEDGAAGSGAGDVLGPGVSGLNTIAIFGSTDGNELDDSGVDIANVVTLAGSQTLTNKTLTSPAISSPTGLVKGDVGLGNVTNDAQAVATLTLTAGAGLTGGGDLSANRTFAVGAGTGITVNADDVALDTSNARNVDHSSVTLTAGNGLTGGGTIESNRTFAVGAGTGITVNADDVALDTAYNPLGKHTIWIPASAMLTATTSGPALAQFESSTYDRNFKVLDFDASADEHAHFNVAFPKGWDESTVTFQVWWMSTATDTDGVAWALEGAAISDNESTDASWGTAVVVTDDAQSAAGEVYVTSESGAVTIGGTPAEGDICYFRIFRDVSDANDDMTEDARLIGVKLFYTTNAATDA